MQQQAIRSRVNCPERLLLASEDDQTSANNGTYSQFQINLQTPVLDPRRCQLIRATIPNISLNLPDWGGLCFFYWRLPTATTVPTDTTYLRCVRLFPSYFLPPSGYTAFTKNRYITDPADFVTLLNTAATAGGDSVTYNPYWVAGDITFTYNSTTKQISFTGNTATNYYTPAGWADPIVAGVLTGTTITTPNTNNISNTTPQPQVAQYTLNLRVGFALSGVTLGIQSFGAGNRIYANSTNTAIVNGTAQVADSFPNLVYTNTVAIYLSILSGASLTSANRHNLLAVVPVQAYPLTVNNYIAATSNLLTKLPTTIQNIQVEFRDDADQPFPLPDSAYSSIELSFSYQEKIF
jgi:hypothetical protein